MVGGPGKGDGDGDRLYFRGNLDGYRVQGGKRDPGRCRNFFI